MSSWPGASLSILSSPSLFATLFATFLWCTAPLHSPLQTTLSGWQGLQCGPALWSALPHSLLQCTSITTFKSQLTWKGLINTIYYYYYYKFSMCIFMSKKCFQLHFCSYRCTFEILIVTTDQSERWFYFSDPVRRFFWVVSSIPYFPLFVYVALLYY